MLDKCELNWKKLTNGRGIKTEDKKAGGENFTANCESVDQLFYKDNIIYFIKQTEICVTKQVLLQKTDFWEGHCKITPANIAMSTCPCMCDLLKN